MKKVFYIKGLKILVISLFLSDLIYGLFLGSSTSLIRTAGHLAILILLWLNHSELKFAIILWCWVMLIAIPLIYPVIATLYILSDNLEAVNIIKLSKNLAWITLGFILLKINKLNKFVPDSV